MGSTLAIPIITRRKFFELKSEEYRDGRKRKGHKIGMGYKALHIMELFTVQCLKVDDVIPILSPLGVVAAATVNITRCGLTVVPKVFHVWWIDYRAWF